MLTWNLSLKISNNTWSIIETVATVIGVITVLVELKESRDLSEGGLFQACQIVLIIMNASNVYKKMELG